MKKIITAILAFLYLGVSSGIAMEIHYCMGEKTGIEFFGGDNEKCSKCGMKEKKGGCCKDEHKQVKLKTEHQKSATAQYIQFLDVPALVTPLTDFSFKGTPIALDFPVSNAPPKIPRERLYILHCVFLI